MSETDVSEHPENPISVIATAKQTTSHVAIFVLLDFHDKASLKNKKRH